MANKVYKVVIDYSDSKSIKDAERKKNRYENMGLSLFREQQTGFNTFVLYFN